MGRTRGSSLWLLFGAMLAPSLSFAQDDIFSYDLRDSTFGAIQLQCPIAGKPLVSFMQHRDGNLAKYTLRFAEGVAVEAKQELADVGQDYFIFYDYDVTNLANPDDLSFALDLMEFGNALLNEVCNGSPETKQRYRELLDSNLSVLGLSPEDYPSNF